MKKREPIKFFKNFIITKPNNNKKPTDIRFDYSNDGKFWREGIITCLSVDECKKAAKEFLMSDIPDSDFQINL